MALDAVRGFRRNLGTGKSLSFVRSLMPLPVKKVLALYGGWSLVWLVIAALGNTLSGHGEYGISSHLVLAFSGLPFGLLSLHAPNGTVLGVAVAGAIGTIQWCAVAELNRRWERWQSARKNVS